MHTLYSVTCHCPTNTFVHTLSKLSADNHCHVDTFVKHWDVSQHCADSYLENLVVTSRWLPVELTASTRLPSQVPPPVSWTGKRAFQLMDRNLFSWGGQQQYDTSILSLVSVVFRDKITVFRVHSHWYEYNSGYLHTGSSKHRYACIPIVAFHIYTMFCTSTS